MSSDKISSQFVLTKSFIGLLAASLLSFQSVSFAQDGAGILMGNTSSQGSGYGQVDTPLVTSLKAHWNGGVRDSFIYNKWINYLQANNHVEASHLYSKLIEKESSRNHAIINAVQAYSYYKQGLMNAFISQSLKFLGGKQFVGQVWFVIESQLRDFFGKSGDWKKIYLGTREISLIKSMPKERFQNSAFLKKLKILAEVQAGVLGVNELNLLSAESEFVQEAYYVAIFNLAKRGKLGQAGQIIKGKILPVVERDSELEKMSRYSLLLGRLLYQAGAHKASEYYYSLVPSKSKDYYTARMERLWPLLYMQDFSQVIGEVESLKRSLPKTTFAPDVGIIDAIVNLKLCRYKKVREAINSFVKTHGPWRQQFNSGKLVVAELPKSYAEKRLLETRKAIETELKVTEELSKKSLKAVLPAIGEQAHWLAGQTNLKRQLSKLKTEIDRRQNYLRGSSLALLKESVRQMKYVKIEALTQISRLKMRQAASAAKAQSGGGDKVSVISSGVEKVKKDRFVFPKDNVYWPDELFNYRAETGNECGTL